MSHPVEEKRKAPPWWLWLVAALAIVALLLLLFAWLDDDDDDVDVAGPGATATATATATETETPESPEATESTPSEAGMITDLLSLVNAQDPTSVVGQRVEELGPVPVQSVVGDKTFWVGPSQDQQVFVFLEEEADAGGVEGKVDVNEGDLVRITGTVEQLPPIEQARQQFELSEENSADLTGKHFYVRAEKVKTQ